MRYIDVTQETPEGKLLRSAMEAKIIGQDEAITFLVGLAEKFHSRLFDVTKPIGSAMLVGPTGSGKTFIAETFSSFFSGDWKLNMLKIDCGEYQHSHEIAKLIGSPPGYLGHRETPPLLTKARIDQLAEKSPFGILLFDEIEKASDALWHIMLSIMDKGTLTLGTNEQVDLTKTIILMTSNAGSAEMASAAGHGFGFQPSEVAVSSSEIKRIGSEAAKRKFTTEFINRLDAIVTCQALTKAQIQSILDLEIKYLQLEIFTKCPVSDIRFEVQPAAHEALLTEGYDQKYNARHIKRAIDRNLRLPLARIIAQQSVSTEDMVLVDYQDHKYSFGVVARKDYLWNKLTQGASK